MRRLGLTALLSVSLMACFDGFGTYALRPAGAGGSGGSGGGGSAGSGLGGASGSGGDSGGEAGASGVGGAPTRCASASTWPCDPVSASDCGMPGSACDIDVGKAVFACFPPPNTLTLGTPCQLQGPSFCLQGSTCLNGACTQFCCDSGLCRPGEACQPGNLPGVTVGLCGCDPKVVAMLSPTLNNLSQQYAPGSTPEGTPLCGAIADGATLQKAVVLTPGRCYTAIGLSGASGVELQLTLATMPAMGTPLVLISSGASSPAPVLGALPTCYKPTGTTPVNAIFSVVGKKGAGTTMAQLYSK